MLRASDWPRRRAVDLTQVVAAADDVGRAAGELLTGECGRWLASRLVVRNHS